MVDIATASIRLPLAVASKRTLTRLERFMRREGVKPRHFATDSGVSRQHIHRLRRGTADPTLRMMRILATSASRILRRKVHPREMFNLGDDE